MAKITKDNLVNYIMEYEDGSLNDKDTLKMFSYLIKTGIAWKLQGSIYGRPSQSLIDRGIINSKGVINKSKVKELM